MGWFGLNPGLVSLNSNSETHMTAICDARLIFGRGWISRVFICCAALKSFSKPSSEAALHWFHENRPYNIWRYAVKLPVIHYKEQRSIYWPMKLHLVLWTNFPFGSMSKVQCLSSNRKVSVLDYLVQLGDKVILKLLEWVTLSVEIKRVLNNSRPETSEESNTYLYTHSYTFIPTCPLHVHMP